MCRDDDEVFYERWLDFNKVEGKDYPNIGFLSLGPPSVDLSVGNRGMPSDRSSSNNFHFCYRFFFFSQLSC